MVFSIDVHFYVSVVGAECDRGEGTREHLVSKLVKCTSLNEARANEFIDAMIEAGKLVKQEDGKFHCTIPK